MKKLKRTEIFNFYLKLKDTQFGPVRESNPGPLAPEARIIPLDQQASCGSEVFIRNGVNTSLFA